MNDEDFRPCATCGGNRTCVWTIRQGLFAIVVPMDFLRAQREADELLATALAPYGASGWVRMAPAGAWNAGDERLIPQLGGGTLRIVHDERGAPYALTAAGEEDKGLLVSLTDEGDVVACAAARVGTPSDLVGIGIDLASPEDFAGERGARFNRLIFSEHEQALAHALADDEATGFAFAFSAKEAGFKACSAPLRRWYDNRDEVLEFDLTQFELADDHAVQGTLRHAHAARAMERMGISLWVVRREICGFALSIALAKKTLRGSRR